MQTDPLFDRHNLFRSALTAILGMAAIACVLYSVYVPDIWRPALAIVGLGITVFAAGVNIHLPTVPPAVVSTENIETVNVQQPVPPQGHPAPPPAPPSDRPAIGKGPRALKP